MWSDKESAEDYLNFEDIVIVVKDILEDKRLNSTSVGIFGSWGSGKSTLLKLITDRVNSDENLVIFFDAWLYQNYSDAKTSLLEIIFRTLEKEAEKSQSCLKKIKKVIKQTSLLKRGLAYSGTLIESAAPLLPVGANIVGATLQGISDEIKDESLDARLIEDIRENFTQILIELKRKVIIVIDNLDRCLPEKALQTLEAIRLFLFLPNTSFVIAADEEMIKATLSQYFPGNSRLQNDYLDKLIQIPITVPKLGLAEIRSYLFLLFAEDKNIPVDQRNKLRTVLNPNPSVKGPFTLPKLPDILSILDPHHQETLRPCFSMCDAFCSLLAEAPSISSNPRTIKRLLNAFLIRKIISSTNKLQLEDSVIFKLIILEKLIPASQMTFFYNNLVSSDSFETTLGKLESSDRSEEDRTEEFKEIFGDGTTEKEEKLILKWASQPPQLSQSVNLKRCAYLYRTASALQAKYQRLSSSSISAIEKIVDCKLHGSSEVDRAIRLIPSNEVEMVFNELLTSLRSYPDWSSADNVKGLYGTKSFVNIFQIHKEKYINFLKEIYLKHKQPWLKLFYQRLEGQ